MYCDESYRQLASAVVMRAICDYVNFSMYRPQKPFIDQSHMSAAIIRNASKMPPDIARSILEGWIVFNESLGSERAYASNGTYNLIRNIKTEAERDKICERLRRTLVNKIHDQYVKEERRTNGIIELEEFFLSPTFVMYTDGKVSGKHLLNDLRELVKEKQERRNAKENIRRFYGVIVKCPSSGERKRHITRRISREIRLVGQKITFEYRVSKA